MPPVRSRLFAAFLCMLPALAPAQSFTLEQVLSAPFSSELQASPRGTSFLWIANIEGRRNLWIADRASGGQDFRTHALTHYDQDDGQELGEAVWLPDGSAVLYVRGGDFESPALPPPNPALLPEGVKQEIWLVPVAGGEPRKIADGRSPALSPDGETLAYLVDDQVWTAHPRQPDPRPKQLFHARGKLDTLRWSPDGRCLAFVSHRGDHSFVGVYSLGAKQLRYPGAGTYRDQEPAWSPDSRQIAFLQLPASLPGDHVGPHRTGEPWSIVIADASTGETHTAWRAPAGPGSVFEELETEDQIAWAADNRIVFPSEADGWLHLYSVPATGGPALLLTPGPFEVGQVTLNPARDTVLYSSNQATSDPLDADRRHIWSVSVKGGTATRLTSGPGIEVSPAVAPDGTLAVLRSDARLPMHPAVVTKDHQVRDLAPQLIPASFPAAKLVVPQQVLLSAADGLELHGQLFLPPGSGGRQKHPALVFVHGGSRRQMLLGWHPMEYYSNSYGENQYLASLGFVVLSVNYRSGIGYGLNFREALNYGPTGASEFNDVLGAGLYLRSRPDVDGSHIGIWGGSYGGYLTALALAHASDLFAAGVDMHGVHDWNLEERFGRPAYRTDLSQQDEHTAWESSPMSALRDWRSPVLLMQGDDDRTVSFSQTVQLASMLRRQGTPVEEHVFPDEVHDFLLHRTWLAAYRYEADFFLRFLQTSTSPKQP